jgi:DNA-binding NarL/FixJ family response regulator
MDAKVPLSSQLRPMPITVSIVEDNRETRESLITLLQRVQNIRLGNAYQNAENALTGVPSDKPDVLLVDINLPGMDGIDLIGRLKAKVPKMQMLVLTSYEESRLIFEALRAGASGYLLKKSISSELLPAIELVHGGGAPMSVQIARQVVKYFHELGRPASDVETLTNREQEVLALLAKGYLYKEIGDELEISATTVKWYLHQIYQKLHVQTRTEAAAKFLNRK